METSGYDGRWWREASFWMVVALVAVIYGSRLSTLPVVGEEGRWARGAVQMLETGDWIVPRQQGQVFPERPPMSSWAMAIVGLIRGDVDRIAIRLPSILAIVATSILLYAYARAFTTQLGAMAAALVYATLGQVLQIGRHGESEALFTFWLSASLLLWHYGFSREWPPLRVWMTGYGCMAMAALVKGPQAPAYFIAVTVCYAVLVCRRVRFVFSFAHFAGIAFAATIIAAWQIPFWYVTDWNSVLATWTGLAADRFELSGLVKHLASYPLETFACLLPWSPLLIALAGGAFRRRLYQEYPILSFLLTAVVVTYPTVWFASAARGRYYMPLYPLLAVMIGIIIEGCVAAPAGGWGRLNWRNFLFGIGVAMGLGGCVVAVTSCLPLERFTPIAQPLWFAIAFAVAGVGSAAFLLRCRTQISLRSAQRAVATIAAFAGLAYTGVVINVFAAGWNDPSEAVAIVKDRLPSETSLVSFGPVDFRFCYHFRDRIPELPWPSDPREVPENVEYFCVDAHPGDTPASRLSGRGRTWERTSGTLPFEWEEVDRICVERRLRGEEQPEVIIARIKRPNGVRTAGREKSNEPH